MTGRDARVSPLGVEDLPDRVERELAEAELLALARHRRKAEGVGEKMVVLAACV